MTVGFIFTEFSDPINQLARKVSKQRYSNIGLFHTQDDKTNIYLPKIYGDDDEIPKNCKTLSELEAYPLTCSYALYSISEEKRPDLLKALISYYKLYDICATPDELLELFLGTGTFEHTGVGIANSIVKKIGITLTKSNASSLTWQDVQMPEDKFDILSVFMSTFRSQVPNGEGTYLLCSHLNNPYLTLLSEKTLEPNREYRNKFVHKNSKIITGLIDTLITKLTSNSIYNMTFSNTVVKSFKDVQEEQKRTKRLLLIALDKIVGANGVIAKDLFQSGSISWDKLLSVSDDIKDGSDIISLITQGKLCESVNIREKPPLSYEIKVESGKQSTNKICLESIRSILNSHETGEIKWGELVNYSNVLFSQYGLEPILISDTKPVKAKLIMDDSIDISLELESGNVVNLKNSKEDDKEISRLTFYDLENLNNILDVLSKDDMKLDEIRTKVTQQLSKRV